jgi:glutathione S-transferase
MKLYYNRPSPYARKVLVVAHEKSLMARLEPHEVDPWSDPPELHAATPVGKVPALVTDDGALITESTLIGEYLDGLSPEPPLMAGARMDVLARAALAQGLTDAAFGIVIERRRPAERQWDSWIDRLRRAVERTLPRVTVAPGRFDLGDIALACALAYLDFRLTEIGWRHAHPALAGWLDEVNLRPSMQATWPPG